MQDSQAELFARSFQSQVARNPGAACLTLPVLRALGVKEAVNGLCASEHVIAHGARTVHEQHHGRPRALRRRARAQPASSAIHLSIDALLARREAE